MKRKMDLQFGQEVNYHTQNEQNIGDFKCDVCTLTFHTTSEQNTHILNHFQKKNFSVCHYNDGGSSGKQLVYHSRASRSQYQRLDPIFTDAVKSESDPSETQIAEYFTTFGGSPVKKEDDNLNYQTEFVRVPDCIEQEPLDIIDDIIKCDKDVDIQETLEDGDADTPMLDDYDPNDDQNDAAKEKIKNQCPTCKKKFTCSTSLKYHMNVHSGIRPFVCGICDHAFGDKRNMIKHQRTCKGRIRKPKKIITSPSPSMGSKVDANDVVTQQTSSVVEQIPLAIADDDPMYSDDDFQISEDNTPKEKIKNQCPTCKKIFSCCTSLKYHMNIHLGIKPFVCEFCDRAFGDKRNLSKHLKIHSGSDTNADDANLVVLKRINPQKYELTADQVESLTCPICGKELRSVVGLKGHMFVHRKRLYQCKLCATITFDAMEKYRIHYLVQHATAEYSIKELDEHSGKIAERESENTDWACEYCNTDFKLEINLAKHIHKDHNEQKSEHSCSFCIESFSTLNGLLVHMRAHPQSTQYKCTFDGCRHGFAYKARLTAHLSKHNLINGPITRKTQDDVRPVMMEHAAKRLNGSRKANGGVPDEDVTCDVCAKKCATRVLLQQHIQIAHKNERIKCLSPECYGLFKGKLALIRHVKAYHPELVRECDTCKKVFFSDAKLAEHQLKHKLEFACNVCNAKFALKHRLIRHMSSHEREAKCDICNEKFQSFKSMMMHRDRHGKQSTITCRFRGCNKIFEDRREFMLHTSQHPESEKAKPICPHCGKAISKSHMNDHINTHTGVTPYECSVCHKKFSKSGSLRRHNMIHTGEKPYICDVDGCKQAYRDTIDLKRHKFSVHKIYTKKHICSICSKVFSERKLLRNHIVKVHDKVDVESALHASPK